MLKAAGRSREASLFNDPVIHLRTSQLCLKYVSFWPVAITPKEEADGALVQRASRDPRGSAMPPQSSLKAGGEERVGRRAIIGTELALTAAQPCADSSFILSWDVFHSKKQKKTCWAGCTAIAWIYFSSISWIVFLLDTGSLLAVQRNAEGALQQSTASADLFFRIFKPEVGMFVMLQLEDSAEGVSQCCLTAINSAEAGLVIPTCMAAQLRDMTQNSIMDPHFSVGRTRSSPQVAKPPQRHGKGNPISPRTQENLAVLTGLQELICAAKEQQQLSTAKMEPLPWTPSNRRSLDLGTRSQRLQSNDCRMNV